MHGAVNATALDSIAINGPSINDTSTHDAEDGDIYGVYKLISIFLTDKNSHEYIARNS
jgi:hypothetical protein